MKSFQNFKDWKKVQCKTKRKIYNFLFSSFLLNLYYCFHYSFIQSIKFLLETQIIDDLFSKNFLRFQSYSITLVYCEIIFSSTFKSYDIRNKLNFESYVWYFICNEVESAKFVIYHPIIYLRNNQLMLDFCWLLIAYS